MPTRFYFGSVATPAVSPPFNVAWEQTGQAVRRKLFYKPTIATQEALTTFTVTVPNTTSQDILVAQLVSDPFPTPVRLRSVSGVDAYFWLVVSKCLESDSLCNAYFAFHARVVSNDGQTDRFTIASSFGFTGYEFSASTASSKAHNTTTAAGTIQSNDRVVVELGVSPVSPTAAGTAQFRLGFASATDQLLSQTETADLASWCEFGQILFGQNLNNYQSIKVGDGMSTGERIR